MRDNFYYKLVLLFVVIVCISLLFVISMYSIGDSPTIDTLILYNWIIKGILVGLIMVIITLLLYPYHRVVS